MNYQVNNKVMLTAGYAFVKSYTYSEYAAPAPATKEHRVWEQVWIRFRRDKVAIAGGVFIVLLVVDAFAGARRAV